MYSSERSVGGSRVAARTRGSPAVPAWWRGRLGGRLLLEVAFLGALFLGYKWVRSLARTQAREAFANAARVVRLERALGLFTELDLQRVALAWRPAVLLLNRYYAGVHFPLSVAFLVWMYTVRPEGYPHIRRLLLTVTGLGLVGHVVFPLAPPRMLPGLGFVDTLARYGPSIYTRDTMRSAANQFAAMPSLHFGWSLLVAYGVCRYGRSRGRWLVLAHPLCTLLAIVMTANHYWSDALVAAALVVGALALDRTVVRAASRGRDPTRDGADITVRARSALRR